MSRSPAFLCSVVWCLILVLAPSVTASVSSSCSIYLASSSESESDAIVLGVFAGEFFPPSVRISAPEIAIPLVDLDVHNRVGQNSTREDYLDEFRSWAWTPFSTGSQHEVRDGDVIVSIPGVGAFGNAHPLIFNADWDQRGVLLRTRDDGVDDDVIGSNHPGRGAYSHYYNVTLTSRRSIPVGMQIFIHSEANDDVDDVEESLIERKDVEFVDYTMDKMESFFVKYQEQSTAKRQKELYDFMVNDVIAVAATGAVDADDTEEKRLQIKELFPESPAKLTLVQEMGGSAVYKNPHLLKSKQWLHENGQCMDGLYPAKSAVPYSGRGAFSKRFVLGGEFIAPMPLIVLGDKSWLDMDFTKATSHKNEESRNAYYEKRTEDDVVRRQLLLNYCFGHRDSSLLLCPLGSAVNFINHKSASAMGGPNAKLIWTQRPYHNPEWLSASVDQLQDNNHKGLGLGFDVVATRDIKVGEEVFLDYGADWSNAWDIHVAKWEKDNSESNPFLASALDMNERLRKSGESFKTTEECRKHRDQFNITFYPENVMTACYIMYDDLIEADDSPKMAGSLKVFRFVHAKAEIDQYKGEHIFPCDVLERTFLEDDKLYIYKVLIKEKGGSDFVVKHVPHAAVRFADKPYTSEMFTKNAFRHAIGVPDELFPNAWRNLHDKAEEEQK